MQVELNRLSRWIEINTDAIVTNLNRIRELLSPETKMLAVVKADAYGYGAVEVARVLERQKVDMLGVTNLEEGVELRRQGVETPVLIFAPLLPFEAELAIRYRLTPAVSEMAAVRALAKEAGFLAKQFPLHVKIETGMGRTGIRPEKAGEFIRQVQEEFPQLMVEGIFTHFAQASGRDHFTREQFNRFNSLLEELRDLGLQVPLQHACNSAATLEFPEMHLSMVRVGTLLYGQHPPRVERRLALEDPWKVKARIIHLQEAEPGTGVGYGRDYIVKSPTKIAVIALGYADGLAMSSVARPKDLIDLGKTLVKTVLAYLGKGPGALTVHTQDRSLPIVGRVGMQLSMVKAGNLPLQVGDEVEVPLRRLAANPRLPRVYLKESRPYKIKTLNETFEGSDLSLE